MSTKFKGVIISLAFAVAFYGLMYLAFRLAFGKGFIKKNFTKRQIAFFCGLLVLVLMFVVYTISKNEYVYTWDSAGYWTWSYQHMNDIYTQPGVSMQNLWHSIIDTDYNLIAPTIISLPLKVFGYTFNRFVIINCVMSVLPMLVIAICLAKKLHNKYYGETKKVTNKKFFLMAAVTLVFFLARLIPLFQGYIDMIIMIPILLLFAFAIDFDATKKLKMQWSKLVIMAILLVVTFLLRRYTTFLIVGFCVALLVVSAIRLKRTQIKNFVMNFLVFGGLALFIVMIFFNGLVFRILKEDYADLYSAYNGSLGDKIISLVTRIGLLFIIIAVIGVIVAFWKKKNRRMVLIPVLATIVTIVLFFRVQRMDGHHVLTILPPIFMLLLIGIYEIYNWKKAKISVAIKSIITMLLVLEPVYVYAEFVPDNLKAPGSYMFGQEYVPLRRSDMSVLYELRDYLNETNPKNKVVYVLSSSVEFNWNTLSNLNKPYSEWAVNGQKMTYDADLRDGFPTPFLEADIIVTANPIQLHLKEGSQEVVRYLAEQVQDSSSYIGRHYKKDKKVFNLEYGIEAYVYRKISDFDKNDYKKLFDYFDSYYPDHYTIFGERIRSYEESVL